MNFFKISDTLVLSGVFLLGAVVASYETERIAFSDFLSMRVKIQNFAIFLGLIVAWHMIFSSFGLYNSQRLSSRRREVLAVLKATSLATFTVILAAVIFSIEMATPLFILLFGLLSSSLILLSRLLLSNVLEWIRLRGRNLRYMLIVGTNQRAVQFANHLESQRDLGYRILGFVDEDKEWEGMEGLRRNGYRLVTDFAGFPEYLRKNVVDEVTIALPFKSQYEQASRIVAQCEEQGIVCRHLLKIFNTNLPQAETGQFDDMPIIYPNNRFFNPLSLFVKRTLDMIISLLSMILLFPLFLVVGLLIKLGSPGPALFTQERLGLNKRRFLLYKFRSMVRDAEEKMTEVEHLNEVSGPVFKIKKDPRITKIGRFIRKASIDELPQLINVFKGDMSLVGPRPLPVRDYEGFDEDWHRRRFSVRPGITCLWQVSGRSDVSFDRWMKLDMQYIDQWSLWLDFKILARTVLVVLKGSGAA